MCTNSNKFLFPRSSLPEVLVANDGAQMNWTSIIFEFRLKPRVNAVFGGGLSLLVTKILSLAKMVSWILIPAALQLEAWIVLLMPCIDCIHVPVQAPAQLCYHRKCLWNSWRHGITSREPAELLLRGRKLLQYSQAGQMFLAWQCYKWMGSWGSTATAHCYPCRSASAQLGRCLSSSCSTVRDTCLECRRINLPSGIDNSAVFLARASYRAHALIYFLTETKQS